MPRSPQAQAIIDKTFADLDKIVALHGEGPLFFARMQQGLLELDALPKGDCLRDVAELHAETFGQPQTR